jgi:hypothetical protein
VTAWQLALTAEAIHTLDSPSAAVAGASSIGKSASNRWLDPRVGVFDEHGNRIFILANARSEQKDVNNNERKDGYIFGKGTEGPGYYGPRTRDAYKILHTRLIR